MELRKLLNLLRQVSTLGINCHTCIPNTHINHKKIFQMEADVGNDVITALRSDLAGLQYKRDKLLSEVNFRVNYLILLILIFTREPNDIYCIYRTVI